MGLKERVRMCERVREKERKGDKIEGREGKNEREKSRKE